MPEITIRLRADKYWVTKRCNIADATNTCYRAYLFKAYSPAKSNIDLMLPPPSWRPRVAFPADRLIVFGEDV